MLCGVYARLIVVFSSDALWDAGTEVGGVKCDVAHLEAFPTNTNKNCKN